MSVPRFSILVWICIVFLTACSSDSEEGQPSYEIKVPINPIPKGDRKLNVAPSEGVSGFSTTFAAMQQVGVNLVELNLEWSYFEQEKGVYVDPEGLLQAVGFYADNGIEIGISLATINTVKRTDPAYLNGKPYDDPVYITSFTSLMEWILASIPQHVVIDYISLGNEVNYVLNGEEWDQFRTFMNASMNHLRKQYPHIKYGVKMTVTGGILGENRNKILSMIELCDVAMLNYYPQDNRFRVFEIEKIEEQLNEVIRIVDKNIYFTEIGYQSGSKYCKSSEEKQATFYHWLFNFWDAHDSEIEFIQINWMHDISEETLNYFGQYYGSTDAPFLEYLGTLGLKSHDETSKLAWDQVLLDANARGWK